MKQDEPKQDGVADCDYCEDGTPAAVRLSLTLLDGELLDHVAVRGQCAMSVRVHRNLKRLQEA